MGKIFISYARADEEFVLKLAKDLRAAGVDLWLDQFDISPGMTWDEAVEAALEACPNFMIVLSENAVDSRSVNDEVSFALEENKDIIPVLYKQCKIPFRLRRIQRSDFTGDYDTALAALLQTPGVKKKTGQPTPAKSGEGLGSGKKIDGELERPALTDEMDSRTLDVKKKTIRPKPAPRVEKAKPAVVH